jgi:hypothetical protein
MAYSAAVANGISVDLAKAVRGLVVHIRPTQAAVATADATDVMTGIALLNDCRAALLAHAAEVCDDATGAGAHLAGYALELPPAVNEGSVPTPRDIGDARTLALALERGINAHVVYAPAHFGDPTARCSLPSGCEDRLWVTANTVKAALNDHLNAPAFASAAAT